MPFEVVNELTTGTSRFGTDVVLNANWIDKGTQPTQLSSFLNNALDPGEAAVIQTALDRHINRVAIDEKVGRRFARLHGLKVTGSLGILLKAKSEGVVPAIKPAIAKMEKHGIWIAKNLVASVLEQANE